MGSWFFSEQWNGADVDAGFRAMHDEDCRMQGDDPYTGSMGQKSGFVRLAATPVSEDEARRLSDEYSDASDKSDDCCGAIPLAGRAGKRRTMRPTVRATSERAAKKLLKEKYGSDLVKIVSLETKSALPHSGKVVATKREVKPRIVWAVNGQGEHRTKTEATKVARAKAAAFAVAVKAGQKKYVSSSDGEYFVAPVVAGGLDAALVLKVGLFDKEVAWSAVVETQKVDTTKPGSWLFVGWARS